MEHLKPLASRLAKDLQLLEEDPICNKCGINSRRFDQRMCHGCHAAYGRAWRRKHREYSRLRERQRYHRMSDERKLAKARVAVAVRAGRLVAPESCEVCSVKDVRLHGHHEDYSKPLEVIWMCPLCHSAEHKPKPSMSHVEP